jgi:hypothetical protein
MEDCLKHYEENTDVENEWGNIKIYTTENSRRSSGKIIVSHTGNI